MAMSYPLTIPLTLCAANTQYTVATTIGNSKLNLLISPARQGTVVNGIRCNDPSSQYCVLQPDQHYYNSSNSTTSIYYSNITQPIDNPGSTTWDYIGHSYTYSDYVNLGNYTQNMPLINFTTYPADVISLTSDILNTNNNICQNDGTIGIGNPSPYANHIVNTNWFTAWYNDNKPYGAANIIELNLCESNPSIQLGGITYNTSDKLHVVYVDNIIDTVTPTFNVNSISLGDTRLNVTQPNNATQHMSIATDDKYTILPLSIYDQIIHLINTSLDFKQAFGNVSDTFFTNTRNVYQNTSMTQITVTSEYSPDIINQLLPPLSVNITDTMTLPRTLNLQPVPTYMQLVGQHNNQYTYTLIIESLYSNSNSSVSQKLTLGSSALRQYSIAFDYSNNTIGFYVQPSTCYTVPPPDIVYADKTSDSSTMPCMNNVIVGIIISILLNHR